MCESARASLAGTILVAGLLAGCGGLSTTSTLPRPTAAPAPETARVYFLYPQSFPRATISVTHEEKLIGYLTTNSYVLYEVPAGKHLFMMIGPYNTDGLSGDFQGGKTYFVKIHSNWESDWHALQPGSEEWSSREALIADATRLELLPEKQAAWDEEHREENLAKLEKLKGGGGRVIEVPADHCE